MEEWIEDEQTKVPPGALDHLGAAALEKWEIIYQEPYGRCIVAKQNIKAGEILFYDRPVLTGPKLNSGLICLGCYLSLEGENCHLCSKCGWTLCSKKCENKGFHPLECSAFVKANFKVNLEDFGAENPLYESILPLRCLLLKDSKKKAVLECLESHDELREGTENWNYEKKNVCEFLTKKVGLPFTSEEIHSACGKLEVNCHEVRGNLSDCRNEFRVRGIYPLCAMLSHTCAPNTHHTIQDDMTLVMVSGTDIVAGQQITGTYTPLLSATSVRRYNLKRGKFFDCVCRRCSDPTELGTYFSALCCTQKNCRGRVLCKDPLHSQNKADYACDTCKTEISHETVAKITDSFSLEIDAAGEEDITVLENLIAKYSQYLPPTHALIISVQNSLGQMYGRLPGSSVKYLPPVSLARKLECCSAVSEALNKFLPGISRLRGLVKYEQHVSFLLQINRSFKDFQLGRKSYLRSLKEALEMLSDSIRCLQFEPASSFEGEICKISRLSLQELQKWISTVNELDASHFVPEIKTDSNHQMELSSQDLSLEDLLKQLE